MYPSDSVRRHRWPALQVIGDSIVEDQSSGRRFSNTRAKDSHGLRWILDLKLGVLGNHQHNDGLHLMNG